MTSSTPVTWRSSCFQRCNDEALDPFQGDWGSVMAAFRASVGRENGACATALYEQVFTTSEAQPRAHLMLTQHEGNAIILVLHRPCHHVAPAGSNASKLDIAFMGDMRGLLPPALVCFPKDGFARSGNLLVPNPETLHQAFAGDPALIAVGPCETDNAGPDGCCGHLAHHLSSTQARTQQ